ncbi:protein translocase subunit SecF [Streptomyces sp. HNM0575]|uniref:protein translocase subunit SecF n=1 Tax=Streptomyces sp. HNM0575 TaxID=2716338 RepID=UPI00145D2870|nr:protein translocase subunit SecF [Streptomyces sp. HNM0575]NLU73721.1 protein translocase subunit SecF [Streptomyces sp. HNM0575]
MSRLGNIGARLYRGDVGYDFIGHRKLWYGISILITITAIVGLVVRGLNMGIEFQGGAVLTTPKTSATVTHTKEVAEKESGHQAIVQKLGNGGMRIQIAGLDTAKSTDVKTSLADDLKVDGNNIDTQLVGPSWGEQIASKAWLGLGIFMVLVVIYLAIAFEWRMALAALIALIHDITITVGIYSLVGFEVTPGTVIGLLTILGYSLYDTVVVFDSLRESSRNATKQTRYTYSEIANRSINSTLVRSINTTIVALLPVAGLLFIGGGLLGGGMLNDIALSLFVGLAAGAYSSIFIATPLVADFKERESQMKALARRVHAKRLKNEEREGQDDPGEDGPDGFGPQDGVSGPGSDHGSVQAGDGGAATAGAGVVGPRGRNEPSGSRSQRRQPSSRNRSRNRPSGKRR